MISRRKLLPAIVVCFVLFALGVIAIVAECSVPVTPPQGHKAPSTRSASVFETMQTQAIEIAAQNDRFVNGVIEAQRANHLLAGDVAKLLQPSIAISKADGQIATVLADILKHSAGKTPAALDAACAEFAKVQTAVTVGFPIQLATIVKSANEARVALPIVKLHEKREALAANLDRIKRLAAMIDAELKREGVLK